MSEHTALPWRIEDGSIMGSWEDGETIQVALMGTTSWSTNPDFDDVVLNGRKNTRMRLESKANAELIIQSVNSHAKLLAAAKRAECVLTAVDKQTIPTIYDGILEQLREVIREAEF